jgi:hypothetical protein
MTSLSVVCKLLTVRCSFLPYSVIGYVIATRNEAYPGEPTYEAVGVCCAGAAGLIRSLFILVQKF